MQRDTLDLRREDIRLQQTALQASQDVIRAQQAALPAQRVTSAAQYQQNLAQALSQQRMARLLQGQDVSGLLTVDQLIRMNIQGQLAVAENAPALVQAARGLEVAQQTQTGAQLAQQLVAGQLTGAKLELDLANLNDLPEQTDLLKALYQSQRDQLTAQQEERDAVKELIRIMSQPPVAGAGVPNVTVNIQIDGQDVANKVGPLVFGDGRTDGAPRAPSDLPGARHQ